MVLEGIPGASQSVPLGMSFVGVRDGVVVATAVPGSDGTVPGVASTPEGPPEAEVVPGSDGAALKVVLANFIGSDPSAILLDRSVLTPCDATAADVESLTLYAVAGYAPEFSSPDAHMTYAWTSVPSS